MKKIAVILDEYPVISSSTGLAVEKIIEDLKKKYEVYCIAYRGNVKKRKENNVIYLNSDGIDRRKPYTSWRIFIYRALELITIPIYPVLHPMLQYKLSKKVLEVCKRKEIDLLISVYFPGESLYVARYVKERLPQIKLVPYLIDACACGTLAKYLPKKFARKRKIDFELKCVRKADKVVAMESSKEFYIESGIDISKYIFLNPAFLTKPEIVTDSMKIDDSFINILYAGYLYLPDRNPDFIIDALSKTKMASKIRITFLGKKNIGNILDVKKQTFPGVIEERGFTPHDQLQEVLSQADFFLNMGVSNSNAISGKIFEYFAYGKPIISTFFKNDDATNRYMNRYPYKCMLNINEVSIKEATALLDDFISENYKRKVNYEYVRGIYYTSTPKAFIDVIDEVI